MKSEGITGVSLEIVVAIVAGVGAAVLFCVLILSLVTAHG